MADQPKPVSTAAPAITTAVSTAPAALSVIFSQPSWQSTKPDAAKRLADVQLLGLFSGMPGIALAGITVALGGGRNASSVLVYLPSASRVGAAKAVTPRMSIATQTIDGQTETVLVPSRAGERQIVKLTDAIVDAWADANEGQRNPYGVEYKLDLDT